MNAAINTGLLSFGLSGKVFHAPFLAQHEGFNLCAVTERSNKSAEHIYPSVNSFDSVDELLSDRTIELIVVNTPNVTHYEFALKAIHKNKHVLVEKPFTITSKQALELYQQARERNLYVLPYQNRRYDSDFLSVKNIIDANRLGRLVEAHFRFDRYNHNVNPNATKEKPEPGGGLFYDLGPHILDQVISLFGIPLRWQKSIGYFRPSTKVDDYAHIQLAYPQDLRVFITTSLMVADAQPAYILHGTEGSYVKQRTNVQEQQLLGGVQLDAPLFGLEPEGVEGVLTTMSEQGMKSQEKVAACSSSYLQLFDAVYKTIREGNQYPVTKQQVIQQLEILEG